MATDRRLYNTSFFYLALQHLLGAKLEQAGITANRCGINGPHPLSDKAVQVIRRQHLWQSFHVSDSNDLRQDAVGIGKLLTDCLYFALITSDSHLRQSINI